MTTNDKIQRLESLKHNIAQHEKHEDNFPYLEELRQEELKLENSGGYSSLYFKDLKNTEKFQVRPYLKMRNERYFKEYVENFKEDIIRELNRLRP